MAGVHAGRGVTCVLTALALLWIAVPRAEAVEALDGRIQAHGFFEMQIRSLSRDFGEELDLAQWYNVVNVELEFDILPDGWGPFDLLQAYVRAEFRFDCIYYNACGIFPSAKTYGNKSRNLPLRLRDSYDEDYAGVIESNDKATPPGNILRVPDEGQYARDPTDWVLFRDERLPLTTIGQEQDYPVDYDPLLDLVIVDPALDEGPIDPETGERTGPIDDAWIVDDPLYAGSWCPTNGSRGWVYLQDDPNPAGPPAEALDRRLAATREHVRGMEPVRHPDLVRGRDASGGQRNRIQGPIECYTNRAVITKTEKRRGFPGFDTVFDIIGADGERGPNPEYYLADPDRTLNDNDLWERSKAGNLDGSLGALDFEPLFRGLALERDDPAYYALAVEVDTRIIDAVDVSAIDPEDYEGAGDELQQLAETIVYGEGPPGTNPEDRVGGYAEEIRNAGKLYTLDPILDWKFTFRDKKGPDGGTGKTMILAPWLPKNTFSSLAAASNRANPFRGRKTPTRIIRDGADVGLPRFQGQRYHILDLAAGSDVFDWEDTNPDPTVPGCDTGVCKYGPDPVDPRLLKLEQLSIAAQLAGVTIGEQTPDKMGPYPSRFFDQTFGGDFSGIVAKYNTYTDRPGPGEELEADTLFMQNIAVANIRSISGGVYTSIANERTIPYTNVAVTGGFGELPMRVAPDRSNLSKLDPLKAQGLYVPSPGLVNALQTVDFDEHEFNISHLDRALNHGASQSDTYELKEAYLDMEFLDSRLWVRAGIQNIVWGKTELFRTTDQFNPQDLAMASLPGLEESRIGLLSARAVYSFYDVGPLEDVRLELAANFDRIKPADLGACGEPYTFDVVCGAAFGLAVHSFAGIGLAGVDRPPSGWDDVKGIEFGGRLEFRWDRFSFAVTDFYGYNDLPYPDPIFFYERNVDPNTGRPRKAGATGPCENAAGFQAFALARQPIFHAGNPVREFIGGDPSAAPSGGTTPNRVEDDYKRSPYAYTILGIGTDEACLKPGGAAGYPNENRYDPSKGSELDPADYAVYAGATNAPLDPNSYIYQTLGQWQLEDSSVDYALAYHPANQQFFAALCSMTITVAVSLSPGACGFNIFGSPKELVPIEGTNTVPFSEYFALLVAGSVDKEWQDDVGWRLVIQNTKGESLGFIPASPLNRDVRDGMVTSSNGLVVSGGDPWSDDNFVSLDSTMTNEQSALLGCGPFFGTRCDSGADLPPYYPALPLPGAWTFGEGGSIDVLNAEASAVLQAFPGIEGTDLTGDNPNRAWLADAVPTQEISQQLYDEVSAEATAAVNDAAEVELRALLDDLSGITDPEKEAIIADFKADYTGPMRDWTMLSLTNRMEGYFAADPDSQTSPLPETVPMRAIAGDGAPGTVWTGSTIPISGIDLGEIELPDTVPDAQQVTFGKEKLRDSDLELSLDLQASELDVGEIRQTGYPRVVRGLGRFVGGSDSEDYLLDTWATWTDDAQPGTIGFEGSEYCTRYAPDSPYADERGIVRLPGCRGAKSVTINHEEVGIEKQELNPDTGWWEWTVTQYRTIDVVFEDHYTPRQDGCIFSEYMRSRGGWAEVDGEEVWQDGTWYAVRAVNEDGSTDGEAARINAELYETCFAAIEDYNNPAGTTRPGRPIEVIPGSGLYFPQNQPSLRSTNRWTGLLDPRDPRDPEVCDPDAGGLDACRSAIRDTWAYHGVTQSVLGSRTLFHPLAGCESAGKDLVRDRKRDAWLGPDAGFLCDFRTRDFEAEFIEGHAQVFRNEIANWSWNFLMFLMSTSCNSVSGGDDLRDPDCFDPELAWDVTRCSISTPQFCRNVKSFLAIGATNRNHVRAGGNSRFGRRDFLWHSGGEAVLSYARRNVFGFSMDFAEDVSKTNWGLEFTWFGDMPFMNNNSYDILTDSQTLNLTISVDRPTFINFLNANRTFFFNTQWFFQYLLDYDKGFTGTTGPFNVLFTFAFFTGYFQDRLLPQMVTVYDFRSQSGGFLPHVQYRFNERFSVTIGINYWIGRGQYIPMPMRGLAPVSNRAGPHAYEDGTEFLISNFRHRDEAYMRIRWTF